MKPVELATPPHMSCLVYVSVAALLVKDSWPDMVPHLTLGEPLSLVVHCTSISLRITKH